MTEERIELMELLDQDRTIYAIFRQCPYEILKEIHLKHYRENEFLLKQGEIYRVFYILVKGTVDIYVESEHGKKYILTSYKKGDYIGELEMFQQAPYISSVEARGPVTMLEIDRDVYLKWIGLDHNFSEYVIRRLCETSYAMCKNMGENTLYTLKQRVCQYFIDHADQKGRFRQPVNTETLGEQMAVTQRSINRIVRQLRESGIIEATKNGVVIKDYEELLREREEK